HTGSFLVGQNGVYRLVARNVGTAVTTGAATVTDTLPPGLSFVAASGTGFGFALVGPVVIGTYSAALAPGDSAAIDLTVAVDAAAFPAVTNTAIAAVPVDLDPGNDRDADPTTIGGGPNLSLTKRHVGEFTVAQNGRYDLTVTNVGITATAG